MVFSKLPHRTEKFGRGFLLLCLLVVNIVSVNAVRAAPSGCSTIYNGSNGWVIDLCTTDTHVTTPMQVVLNGVSKGNAALVRIYHKSQSYAGTPQVAILYASGFVRLKQNADPSPSIPFGTSFILGPAYWTGPSTYYHAPQLTRLDIDTNLLPNAPLRMKAQGTNHDFAVSYDLTMPPPRDNQTRLHVKQTYTATANINIDATRRTEKQGFKLVQASSLFINDANCTGGYSNCHDSNAARYIGNDLARHQVTFTGPTTFFFGSTPKPLGSTWVDLLHTDDTSWQGNTPNERIALDILPTDHTITPQGSIGTQDDPNAGDNVNVWLHDDGPDSVSWTAGRTGSIGYWLLAQDNPPDPWADLGLRSGLTFLNFEGSYNCVPVKDAAQPTSAVISAINGFTDTTLQLNYNLSSNSGNWAQVRCNFNPPLNLSAYDHLRMEWRGDPAAGNSLQVGLINPTASGENIFAVGYHHVTHHAWWGQLIVPFNFLSPWTSGTHFDPAHVSALFISVVKDGSDDTGNAASIAIDNLGAYNVGSRTVPASFETVDPNPVAAQAAANWLASQQKDKGLLRSWDQDPVCWSYTYDQALALIVFSKQGMWTQADALVDRLTAVQNADGSWNQVRDCNTLVVPADSKKWEGDIAWTVYALRRYLDLGGTHLQAATALQKGADWLATLINPADGCLVAGHDHTEATIDMWWAFQAAGNKHANNAEKVKNCLMTFYWDDSIGRLKGGRDWWQPYLDNQTWGAAFLKAIGEPLKARRALSYAWEVLRLPAQGGQLFGFDGQAGPWSVWNEGTAQYIAVGGNGARDFLLELLAQQESGAMIGSPDEFSGGGVWTTRWHGVAPTAWLYFALSPGEPFHASPTNTDIYIGSVKQGAYDVPAHGSVRVDFPGLNSGPVKMINTNSSLMFGAERIIYKVNHIPTSFTELMALPDSQLNTTYWLPWYNNLDLDTQLRFANVSSSSATVHVYINGQEMKNNCNPSNSPYTIAAGASLRVSCANINSGPVQITSNQSIVASERVIYKVNGVNTSFAEMMALPSSQLSTTYWLPWYNNLDLDTQLRIGNVSGNPATLHIFIGGTEVTPVSGISLMSGASTRLTYPGVNNGPVKIQSNQNIVAAERVIYKAAGGANTSFTEMMALPNGQLSTTYWLPWYNNADLDTQLRIGNVSNSTATIHIFIGGTEVTPAGGISLARGASTRLNYPGVNNGPVKIQSNQNIVAAERVIYKVNGLNTSFTEMLALPNSQLSTTYWLPWYNDLDLDTQLRFGLP